MHVAAIRPQIEDRIADDLAGTVIGDVAAASGLEDLDAARRERVSVREDVRAAAVSSTPSVRTGGCCRSSSSVGDATGAALLDERALQRERLGVGNDAETADLERAATTPAASAARASSRWRRSSRAAPSRRT